MSSESSTPRGPLGRYILGGFVVMLAVVGAGALPKLARREALAHAEVEKSGPRRVLIAKAVIAPTHLEMTLPGNVAPYQSTPLYAKTTGFVRKYHADLGDRVKSGQLLAEVDAPETAQELQLAQARKVEAEANLDITKAMSERTARLSQSGVVSSQEADEQRARANSALATLGTSKAEVGRLGAIMGYQRVVAPFDGIVVKRGVETGSLVTPGAGAVLFEIAKLDTLKVFVDVPQSLAPYVRVGGAAKVYLSNAPKAKTDGTIARTAGALDPLTRTLRTEIHVAGNGALLSGAFVEVDLSVERPSPPVMVPAAALMYAKEGTRVATLSATNTVQFAKIVIGRDFGKELEVVDGVKVGDTVITNPPDDLVDGMAVLPAERKADGPR
jgi:RND family efflux transporter MFP subunit